jgi:hypothetical protein
MAVPGGTQQTFQTVGIREDLSDLIFDISPTETPFVSGIKRTKVKSTYHEWQTDALAAAADNAQIQGDDAANDTAAPTVRLRNYTQILRKVVGVAGTNRAVDEAGRADEFDYQVSKRSKEIKRDLEYIACRNYASTAGVAASAPHMASLESWIATNKTSVGTGIAQTTPGYSSGTVAAPTDSSVKGSLTEAALKAVIAACWTAGGEPKTLLVGPATKQKISSAFTGIATRYRDVAAGKQAQVISGVDLYVSDFGEHKLVPSRFVRDQNVLVLDMAYWALGELRGFAKEPLAKTGDSDRAMIIGEYTLISRNEAASGKVTDINPAL